jgi:hypothetical protein
LELEDEDEACEACDRLYNKKGMRSQFLVIQNLRDALCRKSGLEAKQKSPEIERP